MALIPGFRCRAMRTSVAFYTQVLDFECVGSWSFDGPSYDDPCYAVLMRTGDELHLSSHASGVFGSGVMVRVDDVDALFEAFKGRGLDTTRRPDSPVHTQPTDQTWGTRELCIEDPDGNRLTFAQTLRG